MKKSRRLRVGFFGQPIGLKMHEPLRPEHTALPGSHSEQRIKELEVQLREAQEKARLFEAVIDVIQKEHGARVVKKPSGRSSRKSSSKG